VVRPLVALESEMIRYFDPHFLEFVEIPGIERRGASKRREATAAR